MMTDILFSPQNNPGGVCLLSLVPTWGVSFDPADGASSGSIAASAVTFKSGYRWFGLYGTDGTKQFTESGKSGENGPYYETRIRCFVPGDALEHRKQLADWLHDWPLLALIEDNAGRLRLAGTITEPIKLIETVFDTMESFGNRPGTLLTFGTQAIKPALYVGA